MTRDQIIDMFAMRLDGYTLQEIGDKYSITRERVRCLLTEGGRMRQAKTIRKRYYPAISQWMWEHGENQISMAKKLGMSQPGISAILTGITEPKKKTIDAILRVTGMKYEEAFARDNSDIVGEG